MILFQYREFEQKGPSPKCMSDDTLLKLRLSYLEIKKNIVIVFFKRLGSRGFPDLFNQYIFSFQNNLNTSKQEH